MGIALLALMQFIHDHGEIDRVAICLDNDRVGRLGVEKTAAGIRAGSYDGGSDQETLGYAAAQRVWEGLQ